MSARTENRFKRLVWLAAVAVVVLASGSSVSAQGQAGGVLETLFSPHDLAVLEQLVSVAQASSPDLAEAEHALSLNEADTELLGRLGRSLEVGVGADLKMDYYSQVSPSYSISLSLDVVELVSAEDNRTVLAGRAAQTRALIRVGVIEAFTRYVVARNSAESAAQALETGEAQFRAVGSLLNVGEATLGDQLAARSAVSSAAVALLTANAEVIVSLEALAATAGLEARAVAALLEPVKAERP